MMSIKNKVPLLATIILIVIVIFFTLFDVLYEKQFVQLLEFILERQMLQRILILYVILIIFTIIIIFSSTKKKYEAISRSERIFDKSIGDNFQPFKCPKCNEIFTIKKLKSNEDSSFVTTCPCCGAIGRIPPMPKSSEIKFECTNCGEQVSIWAGETMPSNEVVVYSCPNCGKKHTMKKI